LRAWSDDVTLFADGPGELDPAGADRLRVAGVTVDERRVTGLRGPGYELAAVVFADGAERRCEGLLVPVTLHQRSPLAAQLGAEAAAPGHVVADAVQVDEMHQSTVPGLSAAGDLSTQMPSVANAIAAGSNAAAAIVRSLVA
jgi:thioredoxin reductase